MALDQTPIREVLKRLEVKSKSEASIPPKVEDIYTPPGHSNALDPSRLLVVGNRGMGKSFWASVLADEIAREVAADAYPELGLEKFQVELGFHEAAGTTGKKIAPSSNVLQQALQNRYTPIELWRAVLLEAIPYNQVSGWPFEARVKWIKEYHEGYENSLDSYERSPLNGGKSMLLIFDALDRSSNDWNTVLDLTKGLLSLTYELRFRKFFSFKIFMRKDQFDEMARHSFSDFYKIKSSAVDLNWTITDLYGALFHQLFIQPIARETFIQLCHQCGIATDGSIFPHCLKDDSEQQQGLFSAITGELLGNTSKRGKAYTWIPKRLADAHGEISLRCFFTAIREAAIHTDANSQSALDSKGIQRGVLEAAKTRLDELGEDHPWIGPALSALEKIVVPCNGDDIIRCWRNSKTMNSINVNLDPNLPSVPIQFAHGAPYHSEELLLEALIDLGIAVRREKDRINIPDIFRVAAKMKRRGGVAPRRG
jgi:hypothetical protein